MVYTKYYKPYLVTQLSCLLTCISTAKVNAGLQVDLNGQPLGEEGRRGVSDGSGTVPSTSGAGAQEPSSSAVCKCGCHDPTTQSAVGQVKEEQEVVRGAHKAVTYVTLAGITVLYHAVPGASTSSSYCHCLIEWC